MTSPAELLALDKKYLIHPHLPLEVPERTIFTRGKGCQLWDTNDREYLDATGGLWLAQIGHGREEMAAVAAEQIAKLEYFTCFWDFSHEKAIELAAKLASLAPDGLEKSFFTSGGSEGNDAAIKTARYYHYQRGEPKRTWILSRKNSYHGLAYGGGTATGFDNMKEGIGPGIGHVAHLTAAHPYRSYYYDNMDVTDFCVAELERKIAEIGEKNIAAMIAEPVLGVGGMVIPPVDYWPRMHKVLKRHGILLIFDEVVSAFGRMGCWFAADHFGVTPDMIITAKGISSGYIPLGAVIMSNDIAETTQRGHGYPVGYTYSGHPVACAIALENFRILEQENLVEQANTMGEYIAKKLAPLAEHPCVGEIRQMGLGIAIELVTDKTSKQPIPDRAHMIPDVIRAETGVIARMSNAQSLVLSPPLTIQHGQADLLVEAVIQVLSRLQPNGSV